MAASDTKGTRRIKRLRSSLYAKGEPLIWLTAGTLTVCMTMIVSLIGLVLYFGLATFWPMPIERLNTLDGRVYMGEITRDETFKPTPDDLEGLPDAIVAEVEQLLESGESVTRELIRTGNFRLTQQHFHWVEEHALASRDRPEWAVLLERQEWGRFYGFPRAFAFVTELELRDATGMRKSATTLREEAQAILDAGPQRGGETRIVVEDNRGRAQLLPVEDLPKAGGTLLGVAELVGGSERAWDLFHEHHARVLERLDERRGLEEDDTGAVARVQEKARLEQRRAEIRYEEAVRATGEGSPEAGRALEAFEEARTHYAERSAWAEEQFTEIRRQIAAINRDNNRFQLLLETSGEGNSAPHLTLQPIVGIVRGYPANQLSTWDKWEVFFARWWEFLSAEPREANSEGGVFPAIFGTVCMTLLLSIAVVPFGVLAALYLHEYAKGGMVISAVRIAVNNLAGVPSIVFGVFGLGFFCYVVGASIDELFFAASLPNPTFGKGGLLWASLTLALLTLPVVIVATEEALSAVPNSLREGSYACGASKWQTIRRIVLPRAMPGIMTGMILAIARGAGEVAPLMLVGAVKLAPELLFDSTFPYLHADRSFMHLGFHIYDVGFQSQNSEAAKPMVYTTTMLLIVLIAALNLSAIWLRSRMRRRFVSNAF